MTWIQYVCMHVGLLGEEGPCIACAGLPCLGMPLLHATHSVLRAQPGVRVMKHILLHHPPTHPPLSTPTPNAMGAPPSKGGNRSAAIP